MSRSVTVAAWVGAVALVMVAVFSGLSYSAASDHYEVREAELRELSELSDRLVNLETFACLDTNWLAGVEGAYFTGDPEDSQEVVEHIWGLWDMCQTLLPPNGVRPEGG